MKLIAAIPAADVDWGHMNDWGFAGWAAMVAFWALIIVASVWVVRELAAPRGEGPSSATEMLERRFAAGEIGVDEYRERRAALEHDPQRIPDA